MSLQLICVIIIASMITCIQMIDTQCTQSSPRSAADARVRLHAPHTEDAAEVWRLVQMAPPLEVNTPYAYLLLCTHFAQTSVVARNGRTLRGFIGGYRIQERPDTLYIWQIAVHPLDRRKGLGDMMLAALISRHGLSDVRFIEASVTPSNFSSNRFFLRFAQRRGFAVERRALFTADHFPEGNHEPEQLIRIGPLHVE
ncbi:MAG: diaminobutyrate acetyltransferase [Candidatus Hydrogenedentes bacterium]|nr:diaminobutyrate acetyltransferase [Candidatus Hydrogenedentota bacterium]